jgi:transcriptional regulator with XRE-family HTH domain
MTPGEALKAWLELLGMSASEFSRQIPCSVSLPGQWIRGVANPSFRMACRVEQITDGAVPRTLWYPPGAQAPINLDLERVEDLPDDKD